MPFLTESYTGGSLISDATFCRAALLKAPALRCRRVCAICGSLPVSPSKSSANQSLKEGGPQARIVMQQGTKAQAKQPKLRDVLPAYNPLQEIADVCVVGCGPAGLALAAELAVRGVRVLLAGYDVAFTNTYGVWADELEQLDLGHTFDFVWKDTVCYFIDGKEVNLGRRYARVSRSLLRQHLLDKAVSGDIRFLEGQVCAVHAESDALESSIELADGTVALARLVVVAAGAPGGKFLCFEGAVAPATGAQHAYGIYARVEGYEKWSNPECMAFMDMRQFAPAPFGQRYAYDPRVPHEDDDAIYCSSLADDAWTRDSAVISYSGLDAEKYADTPSFFYCMPFKDGRVFLQETCLVAKHPVPFALLKQRMQARLKAMGVVVKHIDEEEWALTPLGGPRPLSNQPVVGFGAAAGFTHPATGYSIGRSLGEAPAVAQTIADAIRQSPPLLVGTLAGQAWEAVWPQERRRQAAFHIFGMELVSGLSLSQLSNFQQAFFRMPSPLWRAFLSWQLSSTQLPLFGIIFGFLAGPEIALLVLKHLSTHPSSVYLLSTYLGVQHWSSDDTRTCSK